MRNKMPKKFQGTNTKAAEAKERKARAAADAQAKKQREAEDASWADDDKHVLKKQQRKAEQERKKELAAQKKKELGELYKADEEAAQSKSKANAKSTPKVTKAQIEARREQLEKENAEKAKQEELARKRITVPDLEVEENVNRVIADRILQGEVEARSVEDAISLLSALNTGGDAEKHPEKRMKSSYKAFEKCYLPIRKAENPSLKHSQLRQMLKKEWLKSPENPMNQTHTSYN